MIIREIKLKLNKFQESEFQRYLWNLTGLFNFVSQKIKNDARDKFYHSYYDLNKLFVGHAKKIGIHSQVFQTMIKQAWNAWDKCFKKIAKQPKLKGIHNKLRSFLFPQFDQKNLFERKIKIPKLGVIRFLDVLPMDKSRGF